jgi:hypothetical protein
LLACAFQISAAISDESKNALLALSLVKMDFAMVDHRSFFHGANAAKHPTKSIRIVS